MTLPETGCALSLRWEFDVKSEVNGDNFQEVCKKSREVKIRDGKGRPWERKAKIGEIVPSKSLVGIMGLVYLRCSSGRAGRNQSQAGALGQRGGRCCFCVGLWSRSGIRG